MSTLITGGRIITAADDYVGDIFVDNEHIALIGESLDVEADRVIDAAGKYVLPGGVDVHTHMDTFFGGTSRPTTTTRARSRAPSAGDDDRRLRRPVAWEAPRGARHLAQEARDASR